MTELTLQKALSLDKRTAEEVYEDVDKIWGALTDFKERNPQMYKYLCANGRNLSLADAIQALAQTCLCA